MANPSRAEPTAAQLDQARESSPCSKVAWCYTARNDGALVMLLCDRCARADQIAQALADAEQRGRREGLTQARNIVHERLQMAASTPVADELLAARREIHDAVTALDRPAAEAGEEQ